MDETPIEIVEYDPEWAAAFDAERDRLTGLIGEYTSRIEHVGSTSVRGLGAKPIVDVTAVVTDPGGLLGDLDALNAALGYELSHIPSDWLMLQRADDADQLYNLHLVEETNGAWRDDLLFREYLRSNPDERDEYEARKREAAAANRHDINGYNAAKADICRSILERARADDSTTVPDRRPAER